MKYNPFFICALSLTLTFTSAACATENEPPLQLTAPDAQLTELYTAPIFFEGPAWDPCTAKLYFCAVTSRQILRLDEPGQVTPWQDPAPLPIGIFLSKSGRFLIAEGNTHTISSCHIGPNGPQDRQVLAQNPQWNQPNDLCQTAAGHIYITDPQWAGDHSSSGVYHLDPNGNLTKIIDNLITPNGIITSPDDSTLYVSDSNGKCWYSYPILPDGNVGPRSVFFDPGPTDTPENDLPDGMTIDQQGNLYLTGLGGLRIVNPQGNLIQFIPIPEKATNACINLNNQTLFITCSTKIYSIQLQLPTLTQ